MKHKKLIMSLLFTLIFSLNSFGQIDFEAKSLDGETINLLNVLKSGPVLINFWATWCQPCRAEMKHLKAIYEKYESQGLTIIGVNQDSPRSLAKVKSFISSNKVNYPIVLDPNNKIFQKYNGQVMPYSILLKKNGEIQFKHTGYLPGDEIKLENEIKNLLNAE